MHFDWTVNAGNIMTALLLLIGFVAAHKESVKRLTAIEERVNLMYEWFRSHVINGRLK